MRAKTQPTVPFFGPLLLLLLLQIKEFMAKSEASAIAVGDCVKVIMQAATAPKPYPGEPQKKAPHQVVSQVVWAAVRGAWQSCVNSSVFPHLASLLACSSGRHPPLTPTLLPPCRCLFACLCSVPGGQRWCGVDVLAQATDASLVVGKVHAAGSVLMKGRLGW